MSKQAWDSYWASGLQSCFPKDRTADTELSQMWSEAITQLAIADNADLLELGCGNGFLTKIILNSLEGKQYRLNVLDYSTVQLDDILTHTPQTVHVFQNTAIEKMPFLDESMDVLLANFSFEYAELEEATQQTARVLKDNGQFLFNVHAKNSLVSNISTNIIDAIEQLLSSSTLHSHIREIIHLKLQSITDNKSEITVIAKKIIDELKRMDETSRGGVNSSAIIDDILPIINTSNSMVSFVQLDEIWQRYKLYGVRIKQQLAVGFNGDKIKILSQTFHQKGIAVSVIPVLVEGKIFSYLIHGIKLSK